MNDLPDGMDWIDKRKDLVYPLVFADQQISDAYNKININNSTS